MALFGGHGRVVRIDRIWSTDFRPYTMTIGAMRKSIDSEPKENVEVDPTDAAHS